MRYWRLTLATTFSLVIIGIFTGSYLFDLTVSFLNIKAVSLEPAGSLTPILSFAFLLALSPIGARGILWAYEKSKLPYSPIYVFCSGVFVLLCSSAIGLWLKIQQFHLILSGFGEQFSTTSIRTESINYFSWGFEFIFFVFGIITIALLWLAKFRGNLAGASRTQNAGLVLATLAISVIAFIRLVGFLCNTAFLFR